MNINFDDRVQGTSDIVADLQYWKDRHTQEEIRIQEELKRKKEEEKSKLHIKNCNEFLFVPETAEIQIEYRPSPEEDTIAVADFILEEMSLYNLFRYLIAKKSKSLDDLLAYLYGSEYRKIQQQLPEEQKVEMLQMAEELSNLDEMFRRSESEDEERKKEESKKPEEKKEPQTMADCIKIFAGTITYLCETWGKLPVEILKNMTYRQFKQYLDIIVEKQQELDKKYNKNKEDDTPWWMKNPNNPAIGNDGGKIDKTKQNLEDSKTKTNKLYDNGSISFKIEEDESKRASNAYNPLLASEKGFLKQQGYNVVEDYEGAVVYRKVEKIPDWRANDLFGNC